MRGPTNWAAEDESEYIDEEGTTQALEASPRAGTGRPRSRPPDPSNHRHTTNSEQNSPSSYIMSKLRSRRKGHASDASHNLLVKYEHAQSNTHTPPEPPTTRRALLALSALILVLATVITTCWLLYASGTLRRSCDDFVSRYRDPLPSGRYRYPSSLTRDVVPVSCHSHNDYWRGVPLFEALHFGCTSVEADVWLPPEPKGDDDVAGDLLVGHDRASLSADRTFPNLYVTPVLELLDARNAAGRARELRGVFERDPARTLVLLVDVKTDGYETLPVVLAQLEPLRSRGYLSRYADGTVTVGPVTVVATGETPFDALVANATHRDVFFDAPIDRIYKDSASSPPPTASSGSSESSGQGHSGTGALSSASVFTPENSYYASTSLADLLGRWPPRPPSRLSDDQVDLVRRHVEAAHAQGLKARFWDTPEWPVWVRNDVWTVLMSWAQTCSTLTIWKRRPGATGGSYFHERLMWLLEDRFTFWEHYSCGHYGLSLIHISEPTRPY